MFEAARPDKMPRLDLRVPWVMMRSVIGLSVVALLFIQAANAAGSLPVILPADPSTPPQGSIAFSASSGSGAGYQWSITTNLSGASIDADTGMYVAGIAGSVDDTIQVLDSLGNVATWIVSVGPAISITPAGPSTAPKGKLTFTASGGTRSDRSRPKYLRHFVQ